MPKTTCPVTKSEFMEKAKALEVVINGRTMIAQPKAFSTGSFGWYLTDKVPVEIDGKVMQVQVGCNLAVVGSKEAGE